MQLHELRKELRFNTELTQLVETLKNIAASQYHAMEKEKQRFNEFMDAFAGFFRVVDLVDVHDPLVEASVDVTGIVIVTSDSGFMGGLNQGVIHAALETRKERAESQIMVIGEKGAAVLNDMGIKYKFFQGVGQTTLYEQALEIRDHIVAEVLSQRLGRVVVAYPKPVSFTAQTIDVIGLLPCGELFDKAAPSEVSRRLLEKNVLAEARKVIVESRFSDLVEYLSGVWVAAKLYEVFEDSKLAEFSARAMHLEGSYQELEREQKKLKHKTFKAVHERIDKGMRESFVARNIHTRDSAKRKESL